MQGDQIAEVGTLSPHPGERVIRGEGLVLAPGFIDVHNHSTEGIRTDPLLETQISQGITTVVLGPDGDSPWPIAEYLAEREKSPGAVNVMTMVGHETVRSLVMGKDFAAPRRPKKSRRWRRSWTRGCAKAPRAFPRVSSTTSAAMPRRTSSSSSRRPRRDTAAST